MRAAALTAVCTGAAVELPSSRLVYCADCLWAEWMAQNESCWWCQD